MLLHKTHPKESGKISMLDMANSRDNAQLSASAVGIIDPEVAVLVCNLGLYNRMTGKKNNETRACHERSV